MHKNKEAFAVSSYFNLVMSSLYKNGAEISTIRETLLNTKKDYLNFYQGSKNLKEILDAIEIVSVAEDPHEFEHYMKEDF